VRGIEGNRIHVYFQEKEQQLKSYVEEGILARKRLQAHSYATLQDLEAYILQTISIDGILVVCSPKSMNSVLKVTNNQKNVKLLIYGDSREAAYNSQVINYCENK
jgi:RNA:NAD 2'-phosphotransferase (TPT1/KptA family)